MPEQTRTLAEAKAQHNAFMALLASGAHLDETLLPFDQGPLTPVYEDGTPAH